jgi:hypothetical protein
LGGGPDVRDRDDEIINLYNKNIFITDSFLFIN